MKAEGTGPRLGKENWVKEPGRASLGLGVEGGLGLLWGDANNARDLLEELLQAHQDVKRLNQII